MIASTDPAAPRPCGHRRPPRRAADAPFNQPVVFASTYVGSADTSRRQLNYGRDGNPTWLALEEAIGALEGGRALTFASGMAASHAVLELIEPGAVGGDPPALLPGAWPPPSTNARPATAGRSAGWTSPTPTRCWPRPTAPTWSGWSRRPTR